MLLLGSSHASSINIIHDFHSADPIHPQDTLSVEAKTKIYKTYLAKAIADHDITKEFYGQLYLYKGYYNQLHDYAAATACIQQADSLAQLSGRPEWAAIVELRKGALAEMQNDDYALSLSHYRRAVAYSIQAGDSLCEGQSLEQVSSMFTMLGRSDSAHYYFNLALPILKRQADTKEMELIYFNYALMLEGEHRLDEALHYMDSAIAMDRILHDLYKEMACQIGKAHCYAEKGELDKAVSMYNEVIVVSKTHNWPDRLEKSYFGLMYVYEKKGDFHAAYDDLTSFYMYKDSLINEGVQLTIAGLAIKSEAQQKQIALDKANQALQIRGFGLIVLLLLAAASFILWYLQSQARKKEIRVHQDNLNNLTQMLADKNAQLSAMDDQLLLAEKPMTMDEVYKVVNLPVSNEPTGSSPDTADFENNLYNQRILTYEDWLLFKSQFEKAYPGYLLRLKRKYNTLTEAEERMFLLIKLHLKGKEIAAILGISTDGVKKTRTRLKKRLGLPEETDLDGFITKF